jgi:hypothetical protein
MNQNIPHPHYLDVPPKRGVDVPAAPDFTGSILLAIGIIATWMMVGNGTPEQLGRTAAYGVGFSIAISILCDFRFGFRNLIRADLLVLLAVYGLIYAEFLFPQPGFNLDNNTPSIRNGLELTFIGTVTIALARHLGSRNRFSTNPLVVEEVGKGAILLLFWGSFIFGFLHQWIAVKGDLVAWLGYWTDVRFGQPWARTHFGDWQALIFELSLLLYTVSPLGAIIIVRRSYYGNFAAFLAGIAVMLVMAHAFFGGTRHIFFVHIIMFSMAFCYFKRASPWFILLVAIVAGTVMYFSTNMMISFRQIGFKTYWENRMAGNVYYSDTESIKVDFNLQTLSWLNDKVPSQYDHLGSEIIVWALARPIPRAIWKGKPIGLSASLEEILHRPGVGGTWSVTWIGESYLGFGILGVIVASVLIGAGSNAWNAFGSPRNSDLGIVIFASGFFSFSIAIRSLFSFTTAILPTIALMVFAYYALQKTRDHLMRQQVQGRYPQR